MFDANRQIDRSAKNYFNVELICRSNMIFSISEQWQVSGGWER